MKHEPYRLKAGRIAAVAVLALALCWGMARPAHAAEWQTYLKDDFTSVETMFYTGQAGEAFYAVDDQQRYVINGIDAQADSLSALTDSLYYYYAEASCEIEETKDDGNAFCGLIFHYNKKTEGTLAYYVFYIYGDGYFGAKRVIGDRVDIVIPLTFSDLIELDKPNKLGVDAQGTRFDLYINGRFVQGFTDVRIDGGGFGFYVSKLTTAAFDDFKVKVEKRDQGKEGLATPAEGEEQSEGFQGYTPPVIPRDPDRPVYPWEVGVDKSRKGREKRKQEEKSEPPKEERQPPGEEQGPPEEKRPPEEKQAPPDEQQPPEEKHPPEEKQPPPKEAQPPEEKPAPPKEEQPPEEKPVPPKEKQPPEEKKAPPKEKQPPEEKPAPPEEKHPPKEKPVPPKEKPVPPKEKPVPPKEKPVPPKEKPVPPKEKPVPPKEKPAPKEDNPPPAEPPAIEPKMAEPEPAPPEAEPMPAEPAPEPSPPATEPAPAQPEPPAAEPVPTAPEPEPAPPPEEPKEPLAASPPPEKTASESLSPPAEPSAEPLSLTPPAAEPEPEPVETVRPPAAEPVPESAGTAPPEELPAVAPDEVVLPEGEELVPAETAPAPAPEPPAPEPTEEPPAAEPTASEPPATESAAVPEAPRAGDSAVEIPIMTSETMPRPADETPAEPAPAASGGELALLPPGAEETPAPAAEPEAAPSEPAAEQPSPEEAAPVAAEEQPPAAAEAQPPAAEEQPPAEVKPAKRKPKHGIDTGEDWGTDEPVPDHTPQPKAKPTPEPAPPAAEEPAAEQPPAVEPAEAGAEPSVDLAPPAAEPAPEPTASEPAASEPASAPLDTTGTTLEDLPGGQPSPDEAAPGVEPAPAAPARLDPFQGRDDVVVLEDDFSEKRWQENESGSAKYRYFGAAYEVDNRGAKTMAISYQQASYGDVALSADCEFLDGANFVGYGVAARFSVLQGKVSYYGLFISASGELLLLKVVGGTEVVLKEWTPTSLLKPTAPNRIELVVAGDRLQALINSELAAEARDNELRGGGYALLVGPGAQARFDNLRLIALPR